MQASEVNKGDHYKSNTTGFPWTIFRISYKVLTVRARSDKFGHINSYSVKYFLKNFTKIEEPTDG